MVRYLKDRGVYVLFNTNGTVLNERNGRALIEAGLDELRVSLDASNRESFQGDPWQGLFRPHHPQRARVSRPAGARGAHEAAGLGLADRPERDFEELPAFVQVAAEIGVKEVYLQRLVFFAQSAIGKARPDQALFEHMTQEEAAYLKQAEDLARSLGMTFSARALRPSRG